MTNPTAAGDLECVEVVITAESAEWLADFTASSSRTDGSPEIPGRAAPAYHRGRWRIERTSPLAVETRTRPARRGHRT